MPGVLGLLAGPRPMNRGRAVRGGSSVIPCRLAPHGRHADACRSHGGPPGPGRLVPTNENRPLRGSGGRFSTNKIEFGMTVAEAADIPGWDTPNVS